MKGSALPTITAKGCSLIAALLALFLVAACTDPDEDVGNEKFSVKFSLASVPSNLTLDSLEVRITLGDTGGAQDLTIDLATGASKTQVLAYPGQAYTLTYVFYASGFDVGRGEAKGTLSTDMRVELNPTWDPGKVQAALQFRSSGKLLPAYLGSAFDKALAGKPLTITLDSLSGATYTWYVRLDDSILASGSGAAMTWTPADSLGGRTINVKIVVKEGSRVLEEKDWDVGILSSLPQVRLAGIVVRNDTASRQGSYILYRYNALGRYDSVLTYDTTALVAGRSPVATVAYTYTTAHNESGDPSKAVRTVRNQQAVDSLFSYDAKGRLIAITVTEGASTTTDSLFQLSDDAAETRSYAQGRLLRVLKHARLTETERVDSVFSTGDSGLGLSGLIRYRLDGDKVVGRRVFRMAGVMAPYAFEQTVHNALGAVAFRNHYSEGAALMLEKTETHAYTAAGLLDRILIRDEMTGEVQKVSSHVHESLPDAPPAIAPVPLAKKSAVQAGNSLWLRRLAEAGSQFPARPSTPAPKFH